MSGHLVSVLLTLLKLSGFSYCPRTMVTESDTGAGGGLLQLSPKPQIRISRKRCGPCFNQSMLFLSSYSWFCMLPSTSPPPPQLLQKIPTQYHLNSKFVFMVAVHKAGCAFERRTLHVSFYILHKRVSKTKAVKL